MNKVVDVRALEGAEPVEHDELLPTASVPPHEEPWELPESWVWARLDTLCSFIGRGRGPTYVSEGGVPVVNQRCVRWGRLELKHLKLTAKPAFERLSPELRLRRGDILWNSTGTGTIGRAVVFDGSIDEITADSHLTIVRPASVEPSYLGYFIETARVQHLVTDGHVGSTNQQELPRSFIQALRIPLPPRGEQRLIVARIHALFAEIANGEAALKSARDGLDTFRRALLKAAVTGALTADWRETHHSTETGHDLLARVRAELARRERGGKRERPPAASSSRKVSAMPPLPEHWAWTTLGEVASTVRNGMSSPPTAPANTHEILRISAVRPMSVDPSQIRYLSPEQAAAASDSTVESGDLLFTRYNGSAELVGVGACYRGPRRFYPDKLIRVRLPDALAHATEFIGFASNTMEGRRHIAANIRTTAGQQGLSGESLKGAPLPLPPPAETAEILRRVSEALAALDETRTMLDAEAPDAARPRHSVLKAAFAGRLVPQDPTDEPASAVLARLGEPTAPRARRGSGRRATNSTRRSNGKRGA